MEIRFKRKMTGFVGVERERFLSKGAKIVPRAEEFLAIIKDPLWTYELSACQIEDRTPPLQGINKIKEALKTNDCRGQVIASRLGLDISTLEVAGKGMPLTVYPEPRYLRIKTQISQESLSAACRVTATHFHFGMPDLLTAIRVANMLRRHLNYFCDLGDHSNGERLRLYKKMATHWEPPHYKNSQHFFAVAKNQRFMENLRDCWHLIRISKHGTVELRMFGVTEDLNEICGWIETIRDLIKKEIPSFPI